MYYHRYCDKTRFTCIAVLLSYKVFLAVDDIQSVVKTAMINRSDVLRSVYLAAENVENTTCHLRVIGSNRRYGRSGVTAQDVNNLLYDTFGIGCLISVEHEVASQGAVAVVVVVTEASDDGLCSSIGRGVVVGCIIFCISIEDSIGSLAYLHEAKVIVIACCTLGSNTAYHVVVTVATVRIKGSGR